MRVFAVSMLVLFAFGCSGRGGSQTSVGGSVLPQVRQTGQYPNWVEFNAGPYDGHNDIGIVVGPDKNIWFTDAGGTIGKITMDGTIVKYAMPVNNVPEFIVRGPSKALWFNQYLGYIGRITMAGVITEFTIPIPNERTMGITAGPDGNIWFSEEQPGILQPMIGRITPYGKFLSTFNVLGGSGMVTGPDGRIWFTQQNSNSLGAITTTGQFTPYGGLHEPAFDLVVGPDGNLWFTENDYVGFMTPSGVVTEYSEPTSLFVDSLAFGGDKNVYFTCENSPYIGRISLNGTTKFFKNPSGRGELAIVSGPDSNLWFTELSEYIGVFVRLVLNVSPSSLSFTGPGDSHSVVVTETNYRGVWTASSLNQSVATVAPGGNSSTFIVTAVGSGSTSIDVADSKHNDFLVSVTVP